MHIKKEMIPNDIFRVIVRTSLNAPKKLGRSLKFRHNYKILNFQKPVMYVKHPNNNSLCTKFQCLI